MIERLRRSLWFRALWQSLSVVAVSFGLVVLALRISGWTVLSDDPGAITAFLSSLAQFAAIPVTIAFGVIVLVIQQQATSYSTRAGALVVNSPGFLFIAALLFEVPFLCILLLGVLDLKGQSVGQSTQAWAAGAVGPVFMTFVALSVFSSAWFRRVSPAEFAGFAVKRAVDGARTGDRDTTSLGMRCLGEMLNRLALSTDYTSLHLCMNFVAAFLREYVGQYKPRLIHRRPGFFTYRFPQERIDNTWVEREACTSVRDAVNTLMSRQAPAESVRYLVDGLRPLGGGAVEVRDTEALEILATTFVDMGTTEATFTGATNFNSPALERSAEGAVWARSSEYPEAERILAAAFFILFAYFYYHTERLKTLGWTLTSRIHEMKAKEMKDAGIDISQAAEESRERFKGYWNIRFQDPDAVQSAALGRIRDL